VLVHDVDPDPLLLVAVDPVTVGQFGKTGEVFVGDLLGAEIE